LKVVSIFAKLRLTDELDRMLALSGIASLFCGKMGHSLQEYGGMISLAAFFSNGLDLHLAQMTGIQYHKTVF
jgi:hypothetical protein